MHGVVQTCKRTTHRYTYSQRSVNVNRIGWYYRILKQLNVEVMECNGIEYFRNTQATSILMCTVDVIKIIV